MTIMHELLNLEYTFKIHCSHFINVSASLQKSPVVFQCIKAWAYLKAQQRQSKEILCRVSCCLFIRPRRQAAMALDNVITLRLPNQNSSPGCSDSTQSPRLPPSHKTPAPQCRCSRCVPFERGTPELGWYLHFKQAEGHLDRTAFIIPKHASLNRPHLAEQRAKCVWHV